MIGLAHVNASATHPPLRPAWASIAHADLPLTRLQREAARIRAAMLEEVAAINREVLEPAGMTMGLSNDDVVYVEESIANAAQTGSWVLIKNVHLAPTWLQSLEKRMESLNPNSRFHVSLRVGYPMADTIVQIANLKLMTGPQRLANFLAALSERFPGVDARAASAEDLFAEDDAELTEHGDSSDEQQLESSCDWLARRKSRKYARRWAADIASPEQAEPGAPARRERVADRSTVPTERSLG